MLSPSRILIALTLCISTHAIADDKSDMLAVADEALERITAEDSAGLAGLMIEEAMIYVGDVHEGGTEPASVELDVPTAVSIIDGGHTLVHPGDGLDGEVDLKCLLIPHGQHDLIPWADLDRADARHDADEKEEDRTRREPRTRHHEVVLPSPLRTGWRLVEGR